MPRRSVQFERKPSQRFSRRASYAIKRKLQEQQKRGLSVNTSEILKNEKAVNNEITTSQPQLRSLKKNGTTTNFLPSSSDSKISHKVWIFLSFSKI